MKKIKGVAINDIHFGVAESTRIFNELNSVFIPFLENNEIDILVIDGDYFDKKISLMDNATYLATTIMSKIVKLAIEKKFIIRMVQGTRTHDLNQPDTVFKHYEDFPELDFRIIKEVEKENILGHDFLFIPEEYILDPDDYYKEYKKEDARYSAIFGHGTWENQALPGMIEESNNREIKTAPVFMFDEWKHTIPTGFISFGHIHQRSIYKNKVYYSGAFSVWGFGEKSQRGFTYFEIDEDGTSKIEFKDNTEAPIFDTVSVKNLIDPTQEDIDIEKLKNDIEREFLKMDRMRLDISGLNESMQIVLKQAYAGNPNVQIENKSKKTSQLNESKKAETDQFKKYHYITKRQVPIEEMISRYCREDLGYEISADLVSSIITKEVKK